MATAQLPILSFESGAITASIQYDTVSLVMQGVNVVGGAIKGHITVWNPANLNQSVGFSGTVTAGFHAFPSRPWLVLVIDPADGEPGYAGPLEMDWAVA